MNPSVILNTAAEETYQYFVFELWVNNLMTHIFSINFVWEAYQRYCLLLTLSLPVDKFMMPIKQTQNVLRLSMELYFGQFSCITINVYR